MVKKRTVRRRAQSTLFALKTTVKKIIIPRTRNEKKLHIIVCIFR